MDWHKNWQTLFDQKTCLVRHISIPEIFYLNVIYTNNECLRYADVAAINRYIDDNEMGIQFKSMRNRYNSCRFFCFILRLICVNNIGFEVDNSSLEMKSISSGFDQIYEYDSDMEPNVYVSRIKLGQFLVLNRYVGRWLSLFKFLKGARLASCNF